MCVLVAVREREMSLLTQLSSLQSKLLSAQQHLSCADSYVSNTTNTNRQSVRASSSQGVNEERAFEAKPIATSSWTTVEQEGREILCEAEKLLDRFTTLIRKVCARVLVPPT